MTSRIPPSRRAPEFAAQRAAKALGQQTPGAGKVTGASRPQVTDAVQAALRGRAGSGSVGPIYLEAIVKAGAAAVASNLMPPGFRVPTATTLRAVYVNVGTGPTGSGLTVVVKRSGTTLATVTVAAGATSGSDTGLSTALAKGDLLTTDITAVGSTVAGSDVLVTIEAY
jgi:hypothetical protein